MKKFLLRTITILFSIILAVFVLLYFCQEKLIFYPHKLDENYQFRFDGNVEEINIKTKDSILLNGLLFRTDSTKGLIFYLHGNGGALDSWGYDAHCYIEMGYDVFMLDYRGYGKSEGQIDSETQLHEDVQQVYNEMKSIYSEDKIVVLGYSIGTGLAAKVASANNPRMLILQAPYYNFPDLIAEKLPFIPDFLIRYRFETNQYLQRCSMPVAIFHGVDDRVISYDSSIRLQSCFKDTDILITLDKQGHNNMSDNPVYREHLEKLLNP